MRVPKRKKCPYCKKRLTEWGSGVRCSACRVMWVKGSVGMWEGWKWIVMPKGTMLVLDKASREEDWE